MRFEKGSRVEVFRSNEEPYGSWIIARILSKDGCTYTIRYELLVANGDEPIEEKVHEKDIRPCGPHVYGDVNWESGDLAEVFDAHSWRIGKIEKILQNKFYIVRLCSSLEIKKFHAYEMRIWKAWRDGQWIVIGEDESKQLRRTYYINHEAHTVHRHELDYNKNKQRPTAEVNECNRPMKNLRPTNTYTPDPQPESIECSVASCSSDEESSYDDTMSLCPSKVHELELHAYKTTLRALFASGSLTWEKESLLTNLRLSLHISNEEHLHQLKHLLSS